MLSKVFSKLFIIPIRLYQITLSPLLGQNCAYHPTCSNYAIEAINEWGIIKGSFWRQEELFGATHGGVQVEMTLCR